MNVTSTGILRLASRSRSARNCVSINPINDPPQADAGTDQTVPEASLVTFNGSYYDPDGRLGQKELTPPSLLPTALIVWDFGDGTSASGTLTPTHTYAENGAYLVTLVVTDSRGEAGSDSLLVTVENVPPLVNAGPDGTVHMGDAFVSSGSFTDPGPDTHTANVDYGDGSGVQPLNLTGQSFNLSHVYTYPGYYTLRVNITDDDGWVGTDTVLVTVTPLSDLVLEKHVSQDSVLAGGELGFALTVTKNGPSDTDGVLVEDVLPAGLTFISASPDCTNLRLRLTAHRDCTGHVMP